MELMRKISFAIGEYYHVYNRGVEKRTIFENIKDLERFFQSMKEFNTLESIGSIFERKHAKVKDRDDAKPLVSFVAFCLNPNHYHFLITPLVDKGIEKFMQRLGTGYTMYFNEKHKRSGSLFQGTFKAAYVDSDEYLLRLSAYINLNNKIHKFGGLASKLTLSSWMEFVSTEKDVQQFCEKGVVLNQFRSKKEYEKFALEALDNIRSNKELKVERESLLEA